jgi:hypothetical protein
LRSAMFATVCVAVMLGSISVVSANEYGNGCCLAPPEGYQSPAPVSYLHNQQDGGCQFSTYSAWMPLVWRPTCERPLSACRICGQLRVRPCPKVQPACTKNYGHTTCGAPDYHSGTAFW